MLDRRLVSATTCALALVTSLVASCGRVGYEILSRDGSPDASVNDASGASGTCTLTVTDDGFTDNASGDHADGSGDVIQVDALGSTFHRGFLRFDVAGSCAEGGTIPAGAQVDSATLTLTVQGCIIGFVCVLAPEHSLQVVTSAWTESTLPPGVGPSVLPTVSASFTVPIVQFGPLDVTSAQLAADVQAFLASPSTAYGWRISTGDNGVSLGYGTHEGGQPAKLIVEWHVP